jgi:hypothetical protein
VTEQPSCLNLNSISRCPRAREAAALSSREPGHHRDRNRHPQGSNIAMKLPSHPGAVVFSASGCAPDEPCL